MFDSGRTAMSRTFLLLCLCLLTGCGGVPLLSRVKYPVADERHPVMEVLCVWEAAEGRGLDNQPARGFGGQIMFFASGHKEPARVNGDIRIYVFDEEGVDGDSSKPIHQFDFPAAVWNSFLRPSNLGATYQIFIPYTKKGMHEAKCTLRVRFTPEGGLPIYSRMATIPLSGVENHKQPPAPTGIETASAEVTTAAGHSQESGVIAAKWEEPVSTKQVRRQPLSVEPGIAVPPRTDHQSTLDRLRQAAASASEHADSGHSDELPIR